MKYIVTRLNDKEMIFTFPREVDHDRMAEAMEAIRFGSRQDWSRKLRDGEIVSAGFIGNGVCYGHSETLGIGSRKEDSALLAAAQPTQDVRDAWISVEDRLPDRNDDVLVATVFGSVNPRFGGAVIDLYEAAKLNGETGNITHWMPLPKPPSIDKAIEGE